MCKKLRPSLHANNTTRKERGIIEGEKDLDVRLPQFDAEREEVNLCTYNAVKLYRHVVLCSADFLK